MYSNIIQILKDGIVMMVTIPVTHLKWFSYVNINNALV